ncbi:putative ABC transport system permease protein [Mucilaginibacter lappiensis]|uniref:ABC transport system permease protein n=1 Tax=Mucilaginibacter lappiensis TaxID=354630 RepID=A0ABR6PL68_9SPHI|nr:ABC transporter permease [Mucilaginibacter lappiensis]MBB6110513.1 putative ABC transport system permease protein [Mucilaginibacter lappiensis]SIR39779.1 putative ABC transport system permease protein [Mucilaginibacter lappiensis]
MLKNYLLVALRNLSKHKAFSFINIVGLAIGMAACLLILQYVNFELSFDNFHAKKDRIFRINQDRYNNGKLSTQWAGGAFAPGNAFKAALPEIEDFVKIVGADRVLANYKDQKMAITNDYYVSESFFNIFSFPLISGDPKTALKEPNTVVISEEVAQKLFHDTDPVGRSLTINNDKPLKITGVMKNVPVNSHMKFDFLQSYNTLLKENPPNKDFNLDNAWLNDGCKTYVLLRTGVDPKILERKFIPIVKKVYDAYKSAGEDAVYTLQSVQNIHLYSNRMIEFQPNGDGKSVYLMLGIAIFVIIIAWINYINLATARGIGRAKEVGVRKTLGSAKAQLIAQFMLEAMLLNGLAIVLAIVFILICLPVFSRVSGLQMGFDMFTKPIFWGFMLGIFVLGSFFSGFYPAIVLSSFRPVEVMKGKILASPKGVVLRKAMVVFQFAASIFLLIGSLTVFRQLKFMQNQKLGLKIDQTLIIKPPLNKIDSFYRDMSAFKQESLRQSVVKSVTVSTSIPGEPIGWNAGGIKLTTADQSQGKQYRIIGSDYDYLAAYDLKLVAGRKFSKDYGNDPHSVVLSKKAAEQMGFTKPEDALGKQVDFWGQAYRIVGVVDNFHQQSLRDAYDAIIFRCIPDVRGYVSIKISTTNLPQTIADLKKTWAAFFPGDQFDYFFLDQYFNEQYQTDQRFGQVFGVFTGIAIFVACLGLFGLVSYTIVQRTKEIGIRKVLGATVNSILTLLYKDFAALVIISFVVSAPLAWYAINQWLQTYAFRVDIGPLLFLVPFLIVMVIAFATVSYLSVKAALTNPVKSLKTE